MTEVNQYAWVPPLITSLIAITLGIIGFICAPGPDKG
jgi:hypothetical protein